MLFADSLGNPKHATTFGVCVIHIKNDKIPSKKYWYEAQKLDEKENYNPHI